MSGRRRNGRTPDGGSAGGRVGGVPGADTGADAGAGADGGGGGGGGGVARTLVARDGWRSGSELTILTVYLVLLVAIPSRLVLGPLGAAGTPASLWGLVALLYWTSERLVAPPRRGPRWGGLHLAAAAFGAALLAAYAAGMARTIPPEEIRAADRAILSAVSLLGIALIAADGLAERERLRAFLDRLVVTASLLATLGIVQFFTGFDVAARINIPGLTTVEHFSSVLERDDFNRPSGTAIHPIEFGVVLAIVLPLALDRAFRAAPGRRGRAWLAVVLVGVALPMSVSRSAILGALVGGLVLLPTWPRARVKRAMLVLPVFAVCMRLLVPGLLGTIRNLFTTIGSDSSTLSRTNAYGEVFGYIGHAPVFGRGPGTFLPANYVILDNQYLLSFVETGTVGLACLLALFGTAVAAARRARAASTDTGVRELGQSLVAAVASGAAGFATFDAFSFPMATGMMFLVLGCCGALRRSEQPLAPPAEVAADVADQSADVRGGMSAGAAAAVPGEAPAAVGRSAAGRTPASLERP